MKQAVDWEKLFRRLMAVYVTTGNQRQKAVLDNHVNRKEIICRKLGVVCEADIVRISKSLGVG